MQGDPRQDSSFPRASRWREAADLLRFSLEAAAVSGAIVLTAWVFSGTG
ncbi:hypothetical protein KTR66_19845 [Roseococcus sp. SDR]|nr:hypothetical protein [Roseococcus sp. SDR]MBS7792262.1 hypothetical protein [Roseococcus sp. SDR]MBV1847576.1 hypothetical protein [Roseococcus sp. SDR]